MKTIAKNYSFTQTIQKSEFICNLYPVNSIEEINSLLEKTKKKYYDANHNCYAYILGNNAEISKFSDDGEPSQTAGIVIYDVLKKNELTNVLAIVTRYFGGIKLGAGGLVRAYSSSIALTLQEIIFLDLTPCLRVKFSFPYPYLNQILKLLSEYKNVSKKYEANVTLIYDIFKKDYEKINTNLISLTKNQIVIEIVEELVLAF